MLPSVLYHTHITNVQFLVLNDEEDLIIILSKPTVAHFVKQLFHIKMAFFHPFGGMGARPQSTDNKLYDLLGVSRNCTDAELKKVSLT